MMCREESVVRIGRPCGNTNMLKYTLNTFVLMYGICDYIRNGESIHFPLSLLEASPRFELGNQGFADPCLTTWLCRHAGADDEARTRYLHLGKVALYQMSYVRTTTFTKRNVCYYTLPILFCQGFSKIFLNYLFPTFFFPNSAPEMCCAAVFSYCGSNNFDTERCAGFSL